MKPVDQPSLLARAMTWLVVVLSVLLFSFGILRYGWSMEVHERFWNDISGRLSGPMTFRFFLQPTMALIAAIPDGIRDAKFGHSAFFWTDRDDPAQRHGRLRQTLVSTARIMLLGLSMDAIYQHKVLQHFYPVEALLFAMLLAVIPYLIFRLIVEQGARWWLARKNSASSH